MISATDRPAIFQHDLRRRKFLKLTFWGAAAALCPLPAFAGVRSLLKPTRQLVFFNLHTDERLKICYCRHNAFDSQALKKINYILRDHRSGDIHVIDTNLLDLLHAVSLQIQSNVFHVISGYRSPATNARLRRNGNGVASGSLHMQGKI
jgi:uncharacterized protein YcbK (DUF882 family)